MGASGTNLRLATGTTIVAGPTATFAAATAAFASATATTSVAVVAAAALLGELGGDTFGRATGADQFEAFDRVSLGRLGRGQRDDLGAINGELGLGPEHVADLGSLGEQRGGQNALGLLGTRGAPGKRAVTTVAGDLDVDSRCHAVKKLPDPRRW